MNSFSTLKTLFCGSLLALSLVNTTQAGVSLDRTRIVLTGNENSASVNLKNTSPDIPFLAQSWVENEKWAEDLFTLSGTSTVTTP
ncbi:fimbrial chaperone protein [Proteus mirabilis]|uniref:Fimbrial chaperone protein n=1 Tax=Proteus mirabilis TaxID=584 RepID=A0A2X2BM15_PROMI|nr:fimbrial chaperone protein [Proteus mirabilis]